MNAFLLSPILGLITQTAFAMTDYDKLVYSNKGAASFCEAFRIEANPWIKGKESRIPLENLERADELINACSVIQKPYEASFTKILLSALNERPKEAMGQLYIVYDRYCPEVCLGLFRARMNPAGPGSKSTQLAQDFKTYALKSGVPLVRDLNQLVTATQSMLQAKLVSLDKPSSVALDALSRDLHAALDDSSEASPFSSDSTLPSDDFIKTKVVPFETKRLTKAQVFADRFIVIARKLK